MPEMKVQKPGNREKEMLLRWPGFDMPFFREGWFSMNPFALMKRFAEEMDYAFSGAANRTEGAALWSPAVEVRKADGKFMVSAELPGLTRDDVKVQVTDEALILEGERKHEKEEKREGYYHSERSYGRFYRSIPLPEGVQSDKTIAQFNNGVLQVSMPVAAVECKSREVPVQEATKSKAAA